MEKDMEKEEEEGKEMEKEGRGDDMGGGGGGGKGEVGGRKWRRRRWRRRKCYVRSAIRTMCVEVESLLKNLDLLPTRYM